MLKISKIDSNTTLIVIFVSILYIVFFCKWLNDNAKFIFENVFFQMAILYLIVSLAKNNIEICILISISFVMTMFNLMSSKNNLQSELNFENKIKKKKKISMKDLKNLSEKKKRILLNIIHDKYFTQNPKNVTINLDIDIDDAISFYQMQSDDYLNRIIINKEEEILENMENEDNIDYLLNNYDSNNDLF